MALSEGDMPEVVSSGPETACTALSELACQLQALHLVNTPTSTSSRCVHLSIMVDSENNIVYQWHPSLDVQHKPSLTAFIPGETLVASIASKNRSIRHSQRPAILQAWIALPVWHGGHAGHQSSGPERSVGEGCSRGAGGSGAPHSLEGTPRYPAAQGIKRKRGGTEPPPPSTSKQGGTKQPQRNFACPFYLRDRIGHRDCLNKVLRRIADVRQHVLDRTHRQVVHCTVCGIIFSGPPAEAALQRDAHVQAGTCELSPIRPNYPGVTEDQARRIREIARTSRGNQYDEIRRWFDMWDCLFPPQERPESPYLDELSEIQSMVDFYSVIFDNSSTLWRRLPAGTLAATMSLEERRVVMSALVRAFIVLSRGLLVQNDRGVNDSSHVDNDTPAPFGIDTNLGMPSHVSVDSDRLVVDSRQAHCSPSPPHGSRHSHGLGLATPSLDDLPASSVPAPAPAPAPTYPTADLPQDVQDMLQQVQQPTAADENIAMQDTRGFSFSDYLQGLEGLEDVDDVEDPEWNDNQGLF